MAPPRVLRCLPCRLEQEVHDGALNRTLEIRDKYVRVCVGERERESRERQRERQGGDTKEKKERENVVVCAVGPGAEGAATANKEGQRKRAF